MVNKRFGILFCLIYLIWCVPCHHCYVPIVISQHAYWWVGEIFQQYSLFESKSFTSYSCIGHADLVRESSPLFVYIAVSPSVGSSTCGLVFHSGWGRCRVRMIPIYWSFFAFFSIPMYSTAMQDSSQVTCDLQVTSVVGIWLITFKEAFYVEHRPGRLS